MLSKTIYGFGKQYTCRRLPGIVNRVRPSYFQRSKPRDYSTNQHSAPASHYSLRNYSLRNICTHAMSAEVKTETRKAVKEALRGLTAEQMQHESAQIVQQVLLTDAFTKSKNICVYVHCAKLREVDTSELINQILQSENKRCFVPLVLEEARQMSMLHIDSRSELVPKAMGILEPDLTYPSGAPRVNAMEIDEPIDLLLMPGLAFDTQCNRLGRGGGYYDTFVNGIMQRARDKGWSPPRTVALAYTPQIIDSVPMADHDQPVDVLVGPDCIWTKEGTSS